VVGVEGRRPRRARRQVTRKPPGTRSDSARVLRAMAIPGRDRMPSRPTASSSAPFGPPSSPTTPGLELARAPGLRLGDRDQAGRSERPDDPARVPCPTPAGAAYVEPWPGDCNESIELPQPGSLAGHETAVIGGARRAIGGAGDDTLHAVAADGRRRMATAATARHPVRDRRRRDAAAPATTFSTGGRPSRRLATATSSKSVTGPTPGQRSQQRQPPNRGARRRRVPAPALMVAGREAVAIVATAPRPSRSNGRVRNSGTRSVAPCALHTGGGPEKAQAGRLSRGGG
jgi:hypothetical protein